MRAFGFLPEYRGVVVSDWGAYWKFPNVSHAICNAHILRELKGIHENDPKQEWAKDLGALLRQMAHTRNEAMRTDASALPPETVREFQRRYDAMLEQAAKACSQSSEFFKSKKLKIRNYQGVFHFHRTIANIFYLSGWKFKQGK